jgi:hypothetical protein
MQRRPPAIRLRRGVDAKRQTSTWPSDHMSVVVRDKTVAVRLTPWSARN